MKKRLLLLKFLILPANLALFNTTVSSMEMTLKEKIIEDITKNSDRYDIKKILESTTDESRGNIILKLAIKVLGPLQIRPLREISGHKNWVELLKITNEGKIFSLSIEGEGIFHNYDGKIFKKFETKNKIYGQCCALDDSKIIMATLKGDVFICNFDGDLLHSYNDHHDPVYSLFCDPNDGKIFSGSYDNTVTIRSKKGTKLIGRLQQEYSVYSICLLSDKSIVTGNTGGNIIIFDKNGQRTHYWKAHDDRIRFLYATTDDLILSGSEDYTVKVWNKNGVFLKCLGGHTDCIWNICEIKNNSRIIVSASGDRTLRLWDRSGMCLAELNGHKDYVLSLCIDESNNIISSGRDAIIIIWDLRFFSKLSSLNYVQAMAIWEILKEESLIKRTSNYEKKLVWDKINKAMDNYKI